MAASEMVLDVGVYTRIIKAKIVFNHIYFSDLVGEEKARLLEDDFFLKMIDHRNFSPRLIELLTSADYYLVREEPIQTTVLRVLDNPVELWERPYRAHLSTDARCLMWAAFFSGSYVWTEYCLEMFKRWLSARSIRSGRTLPQWAEGIEQFIRVSQRAGDTILVSSG